MIKEFIVSRIEASHDGMPYVHVSFMDQTSGERQQPMSPFGVKAMTISSPEDLMKNLPKAMSNVLGSGMGVADAPTFRLSMREYEDLGLKVGDKVVIELKKLEITGI
jgi:hypothetical protein